MISPIELLVPRRGRSYVWFRIKLQLTEKGSSWIGTNQHWYASASYMSATKQTCLWRRTVWEIKIVYRVSQQDATYKTPFTKHNREDFSILKIHSKVNGNHRHMKVPQLRIKCPTDILTVLGNKVFLALACMSRCQINIVIKGAVTDWCRLTAKIVQSSTK